MTLDSWNTVLQYASAVLLALTFFVGAGAVFTGQRLNKRLAERMASVDRDVPEANRRAAEATQGTAKALADAAHATERTGRVELEAAAQREKAARAERELLELKERLAPRRLSPQQRATLIAALQTEPKLPLVLIASISDTEAIQWAQQLAEILQASGWSISSSGVGPYMFTGLLVVTNSTTPSAAADHLRRAFNSIGLAVGHEVETNQTYELRLMVGSKP